MMKQLGSTQSVANQLPISLILSEHHGFNFNSDGTPLAATNFDGGFYFAHDILQPATEIPRTPELDDRATQLKEFAEMVNGDNSIMVGPQKGGRPATFIERYWPYGRHSNGVPADLTRCKHCEDWRGKCLDTSPKLKNWVVPVECFCENDNRCACCGQLFYRRKLNANFYRQADGQIYQVAGFTALAHRCAEGYGLKQ
jgi:hypothetical protein